MRIIFCGGRDYDDEQTVRTVMLAMCGAGTAVHGACPYGGADELVDKWARRLAFEVEPHPADWKRYGRAAGPRRNAQMLSAGADLVVAFPGGNGTADMKRRARAAGVPVLEVT